MRLNWIFFFGLLIIFFSCRKTHERNTVNFIVTDNGDTISRVSYEKITGYEYFANADKHSIFRNAKTLSWLPGDFGFGIRSKELPLTSCWLVFQEFGQNNLNAEGVPRVPFLHEEYKIDEKFKVELIYNYVDSLQTPPMMYQVYAAVNAKNSLDTILFQETSYLVQRGNRFASLIVYRDRAQREAMRERMDDLATTVKRSYGE